MIKEAIDRVIELSAPTIVEIEGRQYCDAQIHPVREPLPGTLKVHSLAGLVAYMNECPDYEALPNHFIHVESHQRVLLLSPLFGDWQQRANPLLAEVDGVEHFNYGIYMAQEDFCIGLAAIFAPSDNLTQLISLAGNLKDETVLTSVDDGISQIATVRKGAATCSYVEVPQCWMLRPWTTWAEIEQPTRPFIFRVRRGKDGQAPQCALFAVEDPTWKLRARLAAKAYLEANLTKKTLILV